MPADSETPIDTPNSSASLSIVRLRPIEIAKSDQPFARVNPRDISVEQILELCLAPVDLSQLLLHLQRRHAGEIGTNFHDYVSEGMLPFPARRGGFSIRARGTLRNRVGTRREADPHEDDRNCSRPPPTGPRGQTVRACI